MPRHLVNLDHFYGVVSHFIKIFAMIASVPALPNQSQQPGYSPFVRADLEMRRDELVGPARRFAFSIHGSGAVSNGALLNSVVFGSLGLPTDQCQYRKRA